MTRSPRRRTIEVPAEVGVLPADLTVPADAGGIVVFAHGSGSSRHSPRNRHVAASMHDAGLATLLMDLLTDDEEAVDARTGHLRFDISLLARRVGSAVDWCRSEQQTRAMPLGLFGASTGAAAALVAASERPDAVAAVVSRGGRPDLAADDLPAVRAPTLLIVGEHDTTVLDLNHAATREMTADVRLEVVPGAGHLFEEAGALEEVARLASAFFRSHLLKPSGHG